MVPRQGEATGMDGFVFCARYCVSSRSNRYGKAKRPPGTAMVGCWVMSHNKGRHEPTLDRFLRCHVYVLRRTTSHRCGWAQRATREEAERRGRENIRGNYRTTKKLKKLQEKKQAHRERKANLLLQAMRRQGPSNGFLRQLLLLSDPTATFSSASKRLSSSPEHDNLGCIEYIMMRKVWGGEKRKKEGKKTGRQ